MSFWIRRLVAAVVAAPLGAVTGAAFDGLFGWWGLALTFPVAICIGYTAGKLSAVGER